MNGVPASVDCFDWLLIDYMRICLHSFKMKEGRVTLAIATNFDWSLEMFTTRCVRVTVKVGHTHAICLKNENERRKGSQKHMQNKITSKNSIISQLNELNKTNLVKAT